MVLMGRQGSKLSHDKSRRWSQAVVCGRQRSGVARALYGGGGGGGGGDGVEMLHYPKHLKLII